MSSANNSLQFLKKIREESESDEAFKFFVDLCEESRAGADVEEFIKLVDDSNFSLREWLQALQLFGKWLQKRNRWSSLTMLVGYLSCCIQESKGEEPLDRALLENLNTFGFDGES